MGYRSQVGSRRSTGEKFQRSLHEKAKAKRGKRQSGGKYLVEEKPAETREEVVNKTLTGLRRLGSQNFALSPFSQYFDDWLVNLRDVLQVFEMNPAASVDGKFIRERERVLAEVEGELADKKAEEAVIEGKVKDLSDVNHVLVRIDADYAAQTREVSAQRNGETQRLTRNVNALEEELERVRRMKTSFFGGFSKKAKAKKLAEVAEKLDSAKSEIEVALQGFTVEQEKLHDEYERRKQTFLELVQALEKEVAQLDVDSSLEPRRLACEALVNSVNALMRRQASSAPIS